MVEDAHVTHPDHDSAGPEGDLGTQRFTRSRRTTSLAFVGSLAFVAVGAALVAKGDQFRVIVGWAAVGFFGLCALGAIWQFVRPPFVEVSPRGVTLRAFGGEQSAGWAQVGHVTVTTINRNDIVKVESGALVHSWRRRAVAAADLRVGAGWVTVPSHLGVPARDLHAVLQRYAHTYAPDVRH